MAPSTDDGLRPRTWNEFIGQQQLVDRLQVHITAARKDTRPLEHTLLIGPPGFGKNTLAFIISEMLGDELTILKMPMDAEQLIRHLRMFEGGVLFLDELHAANRATQEALYPVLEDGYALDKRGRKWQIPFLTVVAASSERDKILKPLRDRFVVKPEFDDYTDPEMGQIVQRMARKLGVTLNKQTAEDLGRATGGTPRNALDLVIAARDLTAAEREITAQTILDFMRIDPDGLGPQHLRYLEALKGLGGVSGLNNLTMMVGVNGETLKYVERLLVLRGFIEYTARGRELTPAGELKIRKDETSNVPRRYQRK